MRQTFRNALSALACAGVMFAAGTAAAQEAGNQAPAINPVGVSDGWAADVSEGGVVGRTFAPEELALINKVNTYFNGVTHMQARFSQTDAQGQTVEGNLYVRRPGKFRFVYAPPSRLVILSDGEFLAIEDYDLKQVETYSLSSTPFRILLAENVDIARDGNVLEIDRSAPFSSITIEDTNSDAPGKLKLYFAETPDGIDLQEWVVTDAQGLDTRVALSNVTTGEQAVADASLFERRPSIALDRALSSER